ncbi:MAG: dihydropteroate synthase [Kiloniellales bacterium]|nr:dihydropteroate synthase [Kiloniellales bacterium]
MARLQRTTLDYLPARVSERARLYLRPLSLLNGAAATEALERGTAHVLAGGPIAFAICELLVRDGDQVLSSSARFEEIEAWAADLTDVQAARISRLMTLLSDARTGLDAAPLERPEIMGIINATPDSFSDGGEHLDPRAAIEHGRGLVAAGASLLDIGGESTRPDATPVEPDRELARVTPVIVGLAARREELGGVALSIDSRHAVVMEAALALGVDMINDVTALTGDPASLEVAAASRARVVLMHGPGLSDGAGPETVYRDPALDVFDYLESRIAACVDAGIARERLIVDPGIGFGKAGGDNLAILESLALFHGLGCPILLGVSRKGLTGAMDRRWPPKERLPGSLAATLYALRQGVQFIRSHDVAETCQAVAVWERISRG